MYSHTNALTRLKTETQNTLDFAVLNCNAIPLLKMTINKMAKGDATLKLANPDFFKNSSIPQQLKGYATNYKFNMSKFILLSNFSFFEAYVIDAINEMIIFHQGFDSFAGEAKTRLANSLNPTNSDLLKDRAKLQDSYKPDKNLKYIKHTSNLKKLGYKFPSEYFSPFGIMALEERLGKLRSVEIPDILVDALNFPLSENDKCEFHKIRDIRNKIAHGSCKELGFKHAMNYNKFLRELAVRIDKFLVENYFVIERFA